MKDVEKYLKILRDIRAGKSVGKSDMSFFATFTFDVDKTQIEKLQNAKEFKDLDQAGVQQALQDSFLLAVQKPEYREEVLNLAEKTAQGKLSEKIGTALNLALAGTDIATSLGQINASNRQLKDSTRPAKPSPLTADPQLQQALSDAERDNYDAVRALAPAQLAILDSYLSDLNNAEVASGGQAGAYGALAQTASTRRGKRSLELAPIADNIRRANNQRYDQLLGQKLNENRAIQSSEAQFYPQDLYQYGLEQQAAGQLGAQGRANLRSSIGAGASFLPQVISQISTRRKYRDIYNQMNSVAPEFAEMAVGAHANITDPNSSYNYSPSPMFEQAYGPL